MLSTPCFHAVGPQKKHWLLEGHRLEDGRFIRQLSSRFFTYEQARRYVPIGFCPMCLEAYEPETKTCSVCDAVGQNNKDWETFAIIPHRRDMLGDCVTRRQLMLNGEPVPVKPAPDPGPVVLQHEPFTIIPYRQDILKRHQERNPHAGDQ